MKYYTNDIKTINKQINSTILQIGSSVGFKNSDFIAFLKEYGIIKPEQENQFGEKLQNRIALIKENISNHSSNPIFHKKFEPIAKGLNSEDS